MTVASNTYLTDWLLANGVNKNWDYDFTIFQSSEVIMQVRDGTDDTTIVEYTSGFTFAPSSDFDSGVIIYPSSGSALPVGKQIRIIRSVPYTQTTEIGQEGNFEPLLHERAFDKLTMLTQQLAGGVSRSIKTPIGYEGLSISPNIEDDHLLVKSNGVITQGPGLTTTDGIFTARDQAVASAAAASVSAANAAESAADALAAAAVAEAAATGFSFVTSQIFTIASGSTSVTISGGYTVGKIAGVYLNGVRLTDFSATNGTTVTFPAVTADDIAVGDTTATIEVLVGQDVSPLSALDQRYLQQEEADERYVQSATFAVPRVNLCPNGGFEDGLDGISLAGSGAVAGDMSVDYSPIWGARIKIGNISSAVTRVLLWPKFTAAAGETYTFSGDAVLFATSGIVYYQMVWYDATGTATFSDRTSINANVNFSDTATGRQRWAKAVIAPAGTVSAALRLVFDQLAGATVLQARQAKVEYGGLPASFYTPYVEPALNTSTMIEVYPELYGVSTSNSTANNDIGWARLKAAIEAMSGSYGVTIRFSAGLYRFTSLPWPNRHCTRVLGAGADGNGTILEFASTSGLPDPITITGLQHCAIRDVYIRQSTRVAGYAIVLDGGAYVTTIERVRIDYSHNGIWVKYATETVLRDIEYRYLTGSSGTRCGGAAGGCYGVTFDNVRGDNPYRPNLEPTVKKVGSTTLVNWQANQAYAVGEIAVANNRIWQCVVAGTSGSSFVSEEPGTTPTAAFTTNVTDGTVQWAFISLNSLAWCVQDSFAYSLRLDKVIALNGSQGYAMRDTLATGSSYPMWCLVGSLECDHNHAAAINLEAGEGFYTSLVWAGSCLTGNGITIGSGFRGETALNNGTRVHGNFQHGILLQSGPVGTSIIGAQVSNNSQQNVGSFHGINVVAGSTDFTILGCGIGVSAQLSVSQGYSILIGNGCSYGRVALNRLRGASIANINEGTGHTDVQFSLN